MKKLDKAEVRIIHELADGTFVDSMEGHIVPYNDTTKPAFELIAKYSNLTPPSQGN